MSKQDEIEGLVKLIKEGVVGPVTIYGEGRSYPDLSNRMPVPKPTRLQKLFGYTNMTFGQYIWRYKIRYYAYQAVWRTKIAALQFWHKLYPDKHEWHWHMVLECGCCGFEGMSCHVCYKSVIIGYVGYSWPPVESGDYASLGE